MMVEYKQRCSLMTAPVHTLHCIIDFPNLGITYNGGWCTATMTR